MEDKKYNGWANYETWKLALNIDNDEELYKESRRKERTAEELKRWIEEISESINIKEINEVGFKLCDFWSTAEWDEIDFDEIAESFNKDN